MELDLKREIEELHVELELFNINVKELEDSTESLNLKREELTDSKKTCDIKNEELKKELFAKEEVAAKRL